VFDHSGHKAKVVSRDLWRPAGVQEGFHCDVLLHVPRVGIMLSRQASCRSDVRRRHHLLVQHGHSFIRHAARRLRDGEENITVAGNDVGLGTTGTIGSSGGSGVHADRRGEARRDEETRRGDVGVGPGGAAPCSPSHRSRLSGAGFGNDNAARRRPGRGYFKCDTAPPRQTGVRVT